jgi:Gpi18-like mannosyltransferase
MASIDQPATPVSPASVLVGFNFRVPPVIVPILAVALIVRLALASLPGFSIDLGTFQAWSQRLAADKPWDFYQPGEFTDYAPGYMYVLWMVGELNRILHFNPDQWQYILKVPAIVADVASTYLVYRMLEKTSPARQLGATLAYAFFPPALLVGAFWGQVDSILAFFLLLSVYFLSKDRPVAASVAYTIGFLVKPQAVAALPILAFWILRNYAPKFNGLLPTELPWTWIKCTVIPLALLLVLITPFFEYQPWKLFTVLNDSTNVYKTNSFWAYNFWNTGGLFKMGFKPDISYTSSDGTSYVATTFLGIQTRYWGWLLFASAIAAILYMLRNARSTGLLALGVGLSMMAFYLFLTRMHERYVFGALLPLLVACALVHSRVLWGLFTAAAAIHFVNLYHVFGYYYFFNANEQAKYPDWAIWPGFYHWLEREHNIPIFSQLSFIGALEAVQIFSILFVMTFCGFLAYLLYVEVLRRPPEEAT